MIKSTCFLSRHEAEGFSYHKVKPALISIVSPDDDTKPMQLTTEAWADILYLKFHDVDPKGCSESWKAKYRLFNEDDAKAIIAFLDAQSPDVGEVWVHCEAGVSRSAGVAKFIAEKLNLNFPETYTLYNKHVYRTLIDVYYGSYKND